MGVRTWELEDGRDGQTISFSGVPRFVIAFRWAFEAPGQWEPVPFLLFLKEERSSWLASTNASERVAQRPGLTPLVEDLEALHARDPDLL